MFHPQVCCPLKMYATMMRLFYTTLLCTSGCKPLYIRSVHDKTLSEMHNNVFFYYMELETNKKAFEAL